MVWFKVDDRFYGSRKVRRLKQDILRSVGLWTMCGSWSSHHATGGFVPNEVVTQYDPKHATASKLVATGLWIKAEQDGEEGYKYHDWSDYNPGQPQLHAARALQSDGGRRGNHSRWHVAKKVLDPECEFCVSVSGTDRVPDSVGDSGTKSPADPPVPTRPDPSSSLATRSLIASFGADEEETTKVIGLIQSEMKPKAIGPYIRTLAANGDLAAILERIRAKPAAAVPQHIFAPGPAGICRHEGRACTWPPDHPGHLPAAADAA